MFTQKGLENLQYPIIILLIVAQMLVGTNYLLGQSLYLLADCISCYRCFALKRPIADKIKEICFIGVCIGLIAFNILMK